MTTTKKIWTPPDPQKDWVCNSGFQHAIKISKLHGIYHICFYHKLLFYSTHGVIIIIKTFQIRIKFVYLLDLSLCHTCSTCKYPSKVLVRKFSIFVLLKSKEVISRDLITSSAFCLKMFVTSALNWLMRSLKLFDRLLYSSFSLCRSIEKIYTNI